MQTRTVLQIISLVLCPLINYPLSSKSINQNETIKDAYQREDYYKNQEYRKYAGHSLDGVTSASKLAAQRSHTVAGKDERNFAGFTGIVVVAIVIGLVQIIFKKNDIFVNLYHLLDLNAH